MIKDATGKEIKVGDVISYATLLSRSAALKIGVVVELRPDKPGCLRVHGFDVNPYLLRRDLGPKTAAQQAYYDDQMAAGIYFDGKIRLEASRKTSTLQFSERTSIIQIDEEAALKWMLEKAGI